MTVDGLLLQMPSPDEHGYVAQSHQTQPGNCQPRSQRCLAALGICYAGAGLFWACGAVCWHPCLVQHLGSMSTPKALVPIDANPKCNSGAGNIAAAMNKNQVWAHEYDIQFTAYNCCWELIVNKVDGLAAGALGLAPGVAMAYKDRSV